MVPLYRIEPSLAVYQPIRITRASRWPSCVKTGSRSRRRSTPRSPVKVTRDALWRLIAWLDHGGWPPPAGRRILSCVLARVRKWFDGAGWYVGAAVVLLVFALLAVLAGLQSSDSVLWTGQQVTGTEQQGLVYYRWQGQSYSLAVPGSGSSKAVSVYLNPGDPSQAVIDNVFDRVLAGLLVLGPAAGAVVLLVIGGTRNYRWQRRKLKRAREF